MKRRKIRRYGSQTSRRKFRTASRPARVRRAQPEREQQVEQDVDEDQQDVDEEQRLHVVGDVAAGDRREQQSCSRSCRRRRRSRPGTPARTPPRSSAARPRAVDAAGRGDLAPDRERVVVARLEQRGGPRHRLGDEPAGERGREAVANARRRPGPRPAAPGRRARRPITRRRGAHQALGDLDHGPEPPEQLEHVALRARAVDLALGRVAR